MRPLRATYRLQLTSDFGFAEARRVVPYLEALGVSHLYLSPSFQARPGSDHGYDVTDPTRVSADLGGEDAFRALAASGLGVVLDIVPNHMAVDEANPWWTDPLLREQVFDVDRRTGWHRRFFDVDGLAGVRQECAEVFAVTHAKAIELVAQGVVDGVRVDHPDGLADPAGYLRRLRAAGIEQAWVEKILHPGERLPEWPISGTTGYEHLADVTALFVDPAGEGPLTAHFARITGEDRPFAEVAREERLRQATTTFAAEVDRLRDLADVPGIVEGLVDLPVYRTYVDPDTGVVSAADRAAIEAAGMTPELTRILLLEDRGADGHAHDEFVTRFQQTSPPIMAKGVEDTAFYRYARLLSLNEVGSDPGRFSLPVTAFHALNAERAARFPHSLLAATTHDTKRSADCRARISALASRPDEFARQVERWMAAAGTLVEDDAPSAHEQWYLFQTLLGAWPLTADRLDAHLEKALREAKVHTSWVDPDVGYEQRVQRFARGLLDHAGFLAEFRPFVEQLARAGERTSALEALLRCTVPGVPDIFQGDELWFLGLVDPDNRRTLDWVSRRRALARVRAGARPTRATAKLHVLHHALELRRRCPAPFEGAYRPLAAGPDTVAFTRGSDDVAVVAAVRPDVAATVELPAGAWLDVLSGAEHDGRGPRRVADLVGRSGGALLVRPGGPRVGIRGRRG